MDNPADSGEDDIRHELLHERFVAHKAEYREWKVAVERRLASQQSLLRWILVTAAGGAVTVFVRLLLNSSGAAS